MKGKPKIEFAIIILLSLCMIGTSAFFMSRDQYWNADETITYGMSNSYYQGWMLSKGRVVSYLEDNVVGETLNETLNGIKNLAIDFLTNKREAQYFSYPRPSESGWYSKEEIHDWFWITKGEGFNYGSVYVNAMGDDANSFLYYGMIHTVGSLVPQISGTKWVGYTVNILAALAILWCLWKLSALLRMTFLERFMVIAIYSSSLFCLEFITLSRAYTVASLFHLLLVYIHTEFVHLVEQHDIVRAKKRLILLIPIYAIGYVIHYTILFFAAFIGITTIVWLIKKHNKLYLQYIICGTMAVILGMLLDPVSVVGLVSKLGGVSKKSIGVWGLIKESFVFYLTPNMFWFWGMMILSVLSLGIMVLKRKTLMHELDSIRLIGMLWLFPVLAEIVAVTTVTQKDYFKALYPVIVILFVLVLSSATEVCGLSINSKGKMFGYILVVIIGLGFACTSFIAMNNRKQAEYADTKKLREVLDTNITSTAILIRDHACGYTMLNELERYDKVLVLTSEDDKIESALSYELPKEDIMVLGDAQDEIVCDIIDELQMAGWDASLRWCNDGTMKVIMLTRQEQ